MGEHRLEFVGGGQRHGFRIVGRVGIDIHGQLRRCGDEGETDARKDMYPLIQAEFFDGFAPGIGRNQQDAGALLDLQTDVAVKAQEALQGSPGRDHHAPAQKGIKLCCGQLLVDIPIAKKGLARGFVLHLHHLRCE